MIPHRCSFCKSPSIEQIDTEAGNNAEVPVTLYLCDPHLGEYDQGEYEFLDRIEELAAETLIWEAP